MMTVSLIETNYIFNHKVTKIWRYLLLGYGSLLIYYTTSGDFIRLETYENVILILSNFFVISGLLVVAVNMVVSQKIGWVHIKADELVIESEFSHFTFDLSHFKYLSIQRLEGAHYQLKIGKTHIVIKMDDKELDNLKTMLIAQDIKVKPYSLLGKIKDRFYAKKVKPH